MQDLGTGLAHAQKRESRKHDVSVNGHVIRNAQRAHRRSEHAKVSKDHRDALLQSKRKRLDPDLEPTTSTDREAGRQALERATSNLADTIKLKGIPLSQAAREVRCAVSSGQDVTDVSLLRDKLVPTLIKVLLTRQGGWDIAEAVLEAIWAITNLAAGEHEVVRTVLVTAPALIAHLSGWLGPPVAEQCAWALGNMAGEDAACCTTLAANGAVLPLARLVLQAANCREGPAAQSAAATAAWALSNMLWGDPSQGGHLIEVPQLPKCLVTLLNEEHDEWLHVETAWLLAFICAGAEAHMHTMVKHGAADAVIKRLCTTLSKGCALEDSLALVTPLLRCLGNMCASKQAAQSLLSEQSVAAVRHCAGCVNGSMGAEAEWVMAMLDALAQRQG